MGYTTDPGDSMPRPALWQKYDLGHYESGISLFPGLRRVLQSDGVFRISHVSTKQAQRKVVLIIDGHPIHRAKLMQAWREEHQDKEEIAYLPGYSPELNPDEMLNQDVKMSALRQHWSKHVAALKADVRAYQHSTQKRPNVVRNYFEKRPVQYAKAEIV